MGSGQGRGRPWAPVEDLSEPMAEVVALLRRLVDESGLGMRGLTAKLKAEHDGGPRPPGYETLSKRLRGIGLQNEPQLIYSIVFACAGRDRGQELSSRVAELLADARIAVPPSPGTARKQKSATDRQLITALDEINTLRKKLDRLRSRTDRAEKELLRTQELLAAATAATTTTPTPPNPAGGSADPRAGTRPWARTASPPHTAPPEDRSDTPSAREPDPGIDDVITLLNSVPDFRKHTAASLRAAFDSVLDGERTGRYDLDTLAMTEKTYLGSKVEHFLWDAWGLKGRRRADIMSVPVRFTRGGNWLFAPEHMGRVCLLVRADDTRSRWSLGLLKAVPELLNQGRNRDGKQMLSAAGRKAVHWVVEDAPLPENVLLHLDPQSLAQVLSDKDDDTASSRQARTNNLFRTVQGRLVGDAVVRTVAMAADAPKRVREARRHLRGEGILVLGHQGDDLRIAETLGLPGPARGQWISIRVVRRRPEHADAPFVELDGRRWTAAGPDDAVEEGPYAY
ncbi:NaeI family type II restriction endonuclease [Streptomyces tsukubensis]|uniref:NaeI family type II restriction endonuclease n=1 Tax=Streptomyces tsukubensis TaxID=83656 RepID=UPI003696D280